MRRLVLAALFTSVAFANAFALPTTTTGFYYPTGTSTLSSYAGWLAVYPDYFNGRYHLGKDIAANVGADVIAISDGVVYAISKHGWSGKCTSSAHTCEGNNCCKNEDAPNGCEYCNVCVVVKHQLSNGTYFLAFYGHVQTDKNVGDAVSGGTAFASIGPWPSGNHLHFGIHPAVSLPSKFGFGVCALGSGVDTGPLEKYGFVDPIDYITTHTPKGTTPPAPAEPPKVYTNRVLTQDGFVMDLLPGQELTVTLQFKNTGNTTWKGSGTSSSDADFIELRTCNATGSTQDSWLYASGNGWINAQRVGTCTQATVAASGTASFAVKLRVPLIKDPGTYTQYFRLHHNTGGDLLATDGYYDDCDLIVNVLDAQKYEAFTGKFNTDTKWDVGIWDKVNGDFSIALRNSSNNRFDASGYWLTDWHAGALGDYELLVGDFSGDGYSDLCLYQPSTGNWFVAYNQGGYFQQSSGPGSGGAWATSWAQGSGYVPLAGDFSGDGVADVAAYYPSLGRWFVAYNQSATNGGFQQHNGPGTNNSWITGWATEDGNGYRPYAADVSGDGYADIIAYSPLHGRWFVAYNQGGSFQNASGPQTNGSWITNWAKEDGSQWRCFVTDLSGDGYGDLLAYSPIAGIWFVAYNQGGYFNGQSGPEPYGSWITSWNAEHDGYQWQLLTPDVSGDGYADLLGYTPAWGRWFVAYNQGGSFAGESGTQTGGSWLDNWGKLGEGVSLGQGTSSARLRPVPRAPAPPLAFSLSVAPNPTSGSAVINFTLPQSDRVSISIYDISGREVSRLPAGTFDAGAHSLTWNGLGPGGGRVGSGIYFVRFISHFHTTVTRVVVVD